MVSSSGSCFLTLIIAYDHEALAELTEKQTWLEKAR
jgi:hypothetical protein